MKRETAAIIRFTVVCGGKQGIKVEVRGDRRKGGLVLASRLPVEALIELPDETRQGGLYPGGHGGTTVQSEPDGQAALLTSPRGVQYAL